MLFRNLEQLVNTVHKLVNYTPRVVIRNRRKIHQGITGTTRYYQKNLTGVTGRSEGRQKLRLELRLVSRH